MRRFIITSPKFTGQVELIYNTDGLLVGLNYPEVKDDIKLITAFFDRAFRAMHVDMVEAFIKGTEAMVVEADFEVTFEMFWLAYGHKINRKRCIALWDKLTKVQQVKAWAGIKVYDKYLKAVPWGRAKADPDTYLRQEYWENEWK